MSVAFVRSFLRLAKRVTESYQGAFPPDQFVYSRLSDGSTTDMNVDGSSSAVTYKYTVAADKLFLLSRIHFYILDNSVDPADFGGISGGISNGLTLTIQDSDDSLIKDFNNGFPVKKNTAFNLLAGIDAVVYSGTGDDALVVRFTVRRAGGVMALTAGQYVKSIVQDDLSAISEFHVMVQGILLDLE